MHQQQSSQPYSFFNNYQETSLESRQDKTLLGLSLTTVQIRKGQGWIQQALTRLALPHPSYILLKKQNFAKKSRKIRNFISVISSG